jgi:hypothetical protein
MEPKLPTPSSRPTEGLAEHSQNEMMQQPYQSTANIGGRTLYTCKRNYIEQGAMAKYFVS